MSAPWPTPDPDAPDTDGEVRRRQRGRARVMGWLLGALVLLIFFVTIAKIKAHMA